MEGTKAGNLGMSPAGACHSNTLLEKALELHASKQYEAAQAAYREALRRDPRNAELLHLLGALLVEAGATQPLQAEGVALLRSAVNACPRSPRYRLSLGVGLQRLGRWQEAEQAFEHAVAKDPSNVKALMSWAAALKKVGRPQRAAEVYQAVTQQQPDHPSAHLKRASLLRQSRQHAAAAESFRHHLRVQPGDSQARFWLAALGGGADGLGGPPPATPAAIVTALFDSYAEHFDEHLVGQLKYRTPQLLLGAILAAAGPDQATHCTGTRSGAGGSAPHFQRCVDLGCGTGLMGDLVRPLVAPGGLEGVDLSAGMVAKASQRGCYDHLAVGELLAYLDPSASPAPSANAAPCPSRTTYNLLPAQPAPTACSNRPTEGQGPQQRHQPYDLLLAADVFVYIGDLAPVLQAAASSAAPRALLAMSTETEPPPGSHSLEVATSARGPEDAARLTSGFRLTRTGRYTHTRAYLERVLRETGWEAVLIQDQVIRENAGLPVHGLLCVARRLS